MENQPEGLTTQNPLETVLPTEVITLSKEEFESLKHKAEVSSQNFERAKKAEARAKELEELEVDLTTPQNQNDNEMSKLSGELSEVKAKLAKTEVIESYPLMKESWSDFESFRELPDNKGMNMKTAAKAFLTEKGLLEPVRKGLERPTGGKAPVTIGMSTDDVKRLRETSPKKYYDMLKKGQIKIS